MSEGTIDSTKLVSNCQGLRPSRVVKSLTQRNGCKHRWTDRWTEGQTDACCFIVPLPCFFKTDGGGAIITNTYKRTYPQYRYILRYSHRRSCRNSLPAHIPLHISTRNKLACSGLMPPSQIRPMRSRQHPQQER